VAGVITRGGQEPLEYKYEKLGQCGRYPTFPRLQTHVWPTALSAQHALSATTPARGQGRRARQGTMHFRPMSPAEQAPAAQVLLENSMQQCTCCRRPLGSATTLAEWPILQRLNRQSGKPPFYSEYAMCSGTQNLPSISPLLPARHSLWAA
jgi:hypothetical protein